MSNELMEYLPPYYHDILEMQEYTRVASLAVDMVAKAVEQELADQFIETASEKGIARRERMLRIKPRSDETLEFRRMRLKNRKSIKPPFTERWLQHQLDRLLGKGRVTVEVDVLNFILSVNAEIENAPAFREVEHTVRTTIPANLVYQQRTQIRESITLSEKIIKQTIVRQTRLSTTWRLGRTPFAEALDEKEVIQLPLNRLTKLSTKWQVGSTPFAEAIRDDNQ
ncbi:YmfQ family protein [Brevibacillus laterosporus]|uniref:YmfQ family protein n=1 Tax=Brevibacillus laterosporus TaxID=1465 RepID=UPI0021572037|nr:YmfQ family protein [Brevibacillus laterosporus]